MWDAIKADPNNFVQSHEEGVTKVKESTGTKGYAYLMESITLEYITSRDCNVIGIGNPLDTKGYGVAFPKSMIQAPNNTTCSVLKCIEPALKLSYLAPPVLLDIF